MVTRKRGQEAGGNRQAPRPRQGRQGAGPAGRRKPRSPKRGPGAGKGEARRTGDEGEKPEERSSATWKTYFETEVRKQLSAESATRAALQVPVDQEDRDPHGHRRGLSTTARRFDAAANDLRPDRGDRKPGSPRPASRSPHKLRGRTGDRRKVTCEERPAVRVIEPAAAHTRCRACATLAGVVRSDFEAADITRSASRSTIIFPEIRIRQAASASGEWTVTVCHQRRKPTTRRALSEGNSLPFGSGAILRRGNPGGHDGEEEKKSSIETEEEHRRRSDQEA